MLIESLDYRDKTGPIGNSKRVDLFEKQKYAIIDPKNSLIF